MSQVCGLFARRGFNLEAILCRPEGDASESRIWLLLREEERLPQVLAQVRKLEDVLDAGPHAAAAAEFERAAAVFAGGPAQP
jgi:acetolactate synthase-1/3 small subunit